MKTKCAFLLFVHLLLYSCSQETEKQHLASLSTAYKADYFQLKYRDPQTGMVPQITAQQKLAQLRQLKRSSARSAEAFQWSEAGPLDKAGRTRALALDQRNAQIVITGGVRGGIWKSIDGGSTWYQPEGLVKSESITSIVQHPTLPDMWIASTGEFVGSNGTTFLAGALYQSLDNGESWIPRIYENRLDTTNNTFTYFSQELETLTSAPEGPHCGVFCDGVPFLYTNRLVVNPTTGYIYVATNGAGILESKDTLRTFNYLLPSLPQSGMSELLEADSLTSLLLRFDGNANGTEGEMAMNDNDLTYGDGVHGQAAFFGPGSELIFDASDNILGKEGTMEFWIKPIWSGDDGGENDFLIFGDVPGAVFVHRVFGTVEIIVNLAGPDPTPQIGAPANNSSWLAEEWHHLAFTWNAQSIRTYMDGTLAAQSEVSYDLPTLDNITSFKIGSNDVPINAYVDELRISKIARSADEILASYQAGGLPPTVRYPSARPLFSDVHVHPDGDLFAFVSELGYFHSGDQGKSWDQLDAEPGSLPNADRASLAIAPSNASIGYILTTDRGNEKFFKVNFNEALIEDRSENLGQGEDQIYANGWNLMVSVKPDDEDFVLVGGAQMLRSSDGFSSPVNRAESFIAGHGLVIPHVDNHIIAWDPVDPNVCWLGNDGGVWRTEDISRTAPVLPSVIWQDKNNGYRVTQFYTIAIHPHAFSPQIMGGTQDRGTPTMNQTQDEIAPFISDAFGGDGAWCWYGKEYAYASAQGGEVYRLPYASQGQPSIDETGGFLIARFTEKNAGERLFIHPYVVDPNDENILYYPQANKVYRLLDNLTMDTDEALDVPTDWDHHESMQAENGSFITAISISTQPANVLYYATSFDQPFIYRVEHAHSEAPVQTKIEVPDIVPGSFINNVAINPTNADEIAVVISNFNVPGLFHSLDGGQTFTNVEGNLADTEDLPGISFEWFDFHTHGEKTYYLLGSRSGLYLSEKLDGENTVWELQAEDLIGYQLVNMVVSRASDGRVAIGTHGRGAFTGTPVGETVSNNETTLQYLMHYPNPVDRSLTIQGLPAHPLDFKVLDVQGKQHLVPSRKVGDRLLLDTHLLPIGYYVVVFQERGYQAVRFIKH